MNDVGRPARRYFLKKRDVKNLLEEILNRYPGFPLRDVRSIEIAEFDDLILYLFEGKASFFRVQGRLIPSLTFLLDIGFGWLPQVYVDRGAAKAMVRGADLMIPGVKRLTGSFSVGSIVVIVDEESKAPIAIGEALIDSSSLLEVIVKSGRGKAFKNIHHVGDRMWSITMLIR